MSEAEICSICKNPKENSRSGSLTQWINVCNCHNIVKTIATDEEFDQITLHICLNCGKRINKGRSGSLTQFIFRAETCSCEKPQIKESFTSAPTLPPKTKQESVDYKELEYEVDSFPYERFVPLQVLGKGSLGTVYLSRDKLLNKNVAVKIIHNLQPKHLVTFQNEAKAISKLDHPGIVKVLDFGASEAGTPYMVLEFLPGESLADLLERKGRLNWYFSLRVICQVLNGLAHAHKSGIFHRDIKPSNIFLAEFSEDHLEVKLIDFGIAKLADQDSSEDEDNVTIAGTPLYMSPDQSRGKIYDARSEVYSIGCVLFECIAGVPPFIGDSNIATLNLHANEPIPSLTSYASADVIPKIDQVVARALAKEPAKRFQSASAFEQALTDILNPSDELTATITAMSQGMKNTNNWTTPIIISVAVLLGALSFIPVYFLLGNKQDIYSKHFKNTDTRTEFHSERLRAESNPDYLSGNGPKWKMSGEQARAKYIEDKDLESLNRFPEAESVKIKAPNKVTGKGFSLLKDKSKVKKLSIESPYLNDEGLFEIAKLKNLHNLSIRYSDKFTATGLNAVLKRNKIRTLGISRIDQIAPDILSAIGNYKNIVHLNLSELKPISHKQLEEIIKDNRIKELKLEGCDVDDSYIPILTHSKIQELNIAETQITDSGLKLLAKLKTLKILRVSLDKNKITTNSLENLLVKKPKCLIETFNKKKNNFEKYYSVTGLIQESRDSEKQNQYIQLINSKKSNNNDGRQ